MIGRREVDCVKHGMYIKKSGALFLSNSYDPWRILSVIDNNGLSLLFAGKWSLQIMLLDYSV